MSRPKLSLTDDQARSLVTQVDAIIQRHANDTRHHRPFVHDFVRAVYHATGSTYGAAFYRKLLAAYAPGRTPSTPTIESEKLQLVYDLKLRAVPREIIARLVDAPEPAPAPPSNSGTDLALQQLLALQHHTIALINGAAAAPAAAASSAVPGLQAHNDYLRERLASVEAELATTRSTAVRLAAMATELNGTRNFAMQAVDGVRGETRAVRERCMSLEAQLKEKDQQLEMYRRMALSKGAAPAATQGMPR